LINQELQKHRLLTKATIDGQEQERQEIGKELHDNINQHLTTTRLYLEVAKEKASGEVLEMISLAHKNLADIINEIRQLSHSLVPPTLGDLGLLESIRELCIEIQKVHPIRIEILHSYFDEGNVPDNLSLMLFRIVQEQINNIIRHSHATEVQIRLQSGTEYTLLQITDNGIGFDPKNIKSGMGLTNITNRASLFSGKVEIYAEPGKGCMISVMIPRV
jgi:signal transduction histidine kinase